MLTTSGGAQLSSLSGAMVSWLDAMPQRIELCSSHAFPVATSNKRAGKLWVLGARGLLLLANGTRVIARNRFARHARAGGN